MADVENVEDMVSTRAAAAVATESGGRWRQSPAGGGDRVRRAVATESGEAVATESGGEATTGDETVATAGDETAATGEVMFTDKGELEFDEDEMAALEGQHLDAELFPDRSWTSKASMRVSWQEISVAETTVDRKWSLTVDRKRSLTRMMMTV